MHRLLAMACPDNNSASPLHLKGNLTAAYPETKIPQPPFKFAANSECLTTSPRKYNGSTLRIPADPSWPKIPQRRYADNVGDIIDQPCVVTVTATPRRSRSIVRTPNSQIMRGVASRETVDSSYYGSSNIPISQPMTQPLKRRPGCIDPRFKRVTTVKSQMTSTEPQEHEHETPAEISRSAHVIPNKILSSTEKVEHSIPEKDTNVKEVTHEEAEKVNEAKCTEILGIRATIEGEERNELEKQKTDFHIHENCNNKENQNQVQNITQDTKCQKNVSEMSYKNNCDLVRTDCKLSQDNFEDKSNVPHRNENKSKMLEKPRGIITKKTSQCQFSNAKTSNTVDCKNHLTGSNDNQCQNSEKVLSNQKYKSTVCKLASDSKEQFYGEDKKLLEEKISSQSPCKMRANFQAGQMYSKHEINHFKCSGRFKSFFNSKAKNVDDQIQSGEESISLSEDEIYRSRCKAHNILDDKDSCMPATTDSEYVEKNLLSNQKMKPFNYYNSAGEESNFSAKDYEQINFFQTQGECFYNSPNRTEFSENEDKIEREANNKEKKGRHTDNSKFKQKMKSEQDLSHVVLHGRKLSQNSEPHINVKQRRCSTSYSKKILGHFEEKPDITDSEFTFLWPERQRSRRKTSHGYSQKLNQERRNRSCESGKMDNSEKIEAGKNATESKKKSRINVPHPIDFVDSKRSSCKKLYQALPQDLNPPGVEIMKNQNILTISPRADTDITTGKPKTIPIKTQQLLSKSYWEYYNKLKHETYNEGENPQKQYFCQVAMGAPQIKKKKGDVKNYEDPSELSPPEIRTLERCSVLSSMINKALDSTPQESTDMLHTDELFINTNMKSFSDPTAGTLSAVINQVQSGNPLDFYEGSSVSSKSVDKRVEAQMDNRVIKLKTIAFFGILMYAIIVFLPMMYDYFFYDEYDDYEDLTYIEIALDYVVSSFREAFDGVFDLLNKIIFRPSTCRKCKSFA